MKRLFFVLTTFLIITSGYAQVSEKSEPQFYKQGNWEFGFSSNIGSSSTQTKGTSISYYSYDNSQHYNTYDYTENGIYLNLGVSTGFYIFNGLSIEPEFTINSYTEGFSVSILGNLCYTFYLPQKKNFPYVTLGYGLSSGIPSNYDSNPGDQFESLDLKLIDVGAGLKLMYSPGMSFKVEINYRNLSGSNVYSYSDQNGSISDTSEITTSIFSVLLGISILY
jgi:hypothetical protein